MPSLLPPTPLKAPITDGNGLVSQAWIGFFRQLFERVGGPTALTNVELAGTSGNIGTAISNLNTSVSTLNSQVALLQNLTSGLNQGRQL